jgi:hypothetical protein
MNARKLAAIGTPVLLTGGAVLFFLSLDRMFDESVFDKIREGMTEAEVEALIGCPARDYRPRRWINPEHLLVSPGSPIAFPVKCSGLSSQQLQLIEQEDLSNWVRAGMPNRPRKVRQKRWLGKTWGISVAFDENGLVIHHELWEMVPPRPPSELFKALKWYMGL